MNAMLLFRFVFYFVSLSVYLSVCFSFDICLSDCLSVCLAVCPPDCLSSLVCLSHYLCRSGRKSVQLHVCPSDVLSDRLFICSSVRLNVFILSVWFNLSICLTIIGADTIYLKNNDIGLISELCFRTTAQTDGCWRPSPSSPPPSSSTSSYHPSSQAPLALHTTYTNILICCSKYTTRS